MSWKPVRVLFIGDESSSRNVSPDVPFVGTPSYKRLLKWIGELDLNIQDVGLMNKEVFITIPEGLYDIVLFLGKKSETIVGTRFYGDSAQLMPAPRFKTIDHPSPRNRNFNNPAYEKKMLKELKDWIYDGK